MGDWAHEDLPEFSIQVGTLYPVQVCVDPENPAGRRENVNTLTHFSAWIAQSLEHSLLARKVLGSKPGTANPVYGKQSDVRKVKVTDGRCGPPPQ